MKFEHLFKLNFLLLAQKPSHDVVPQIKLVKWVAKKKNIIFFHSSKANIQAAASFDLIVYK